MDSLEIKIKEVVHSTDSYRLFTGFYWVFVEPVRWPSAIGILTSFGRSLPSLTGSDELVKEALRRSNSPAQKKND